MTNSEYNEDAETVRVTIKQSEGKLTMSESGDRRMRVSSPRNQPLSKIETMATIHVSGNDSNVSLELDARSLDRLIDELHAIQQGEVFNDD